MDPDTRRLVRDTNFLLGSMMIAPALYILIATIFVKIGGKGLARDPNVIPVLFAGLLIVSIGNLVVTIFLQKRKIVLSESTPYLSLHRISVNASLGAVLSEAHSVYGLVIALLSGSIAYLVGFSLVTWASLFWIRSRFKHNLGQFPK